MPTAPLLIADREAALLADYAMPSCESAGRVHAEVAHPYRSAYQRDRDRITHCSAFRRLSHKTQVFTGERGDYHRNRLTHTLEVASIARTLGRALRLNEDLIEALALLHDIGHPPFGHAGEEVLDARLQDDGGFNHNRQALRIVERLEVRYPGFAGLNLSREVLDGQSCRGRDLKGAGQLLEVQVVDAADSIAYDAHDADDALELGLLETGDLLQLPLWREAAARVIARHDDLSDTELRRAVIHELIDHEVSSLLDVTERQLAEQDITCREQLATAGPLLAPLDELASKKRQLQEFLFARVYRHPDVLVQRRVATEELDELFTYFVTNPNKLPQFYQQVAGEAGEPRAVADYLSSFTDRGAREAFKRVYSDQ